MIRNYLTIALRSMLRNKAYTITNILGLSMGIVCCLLLADYVNDEANFNQHQSNINDIPHAASIMPDEHEMRTAPAPVARRTKDEAPEAARTPGNTNPADEDQLVRYNDMPLLENESPMPDTTLFDVITYHSRSRNPKKALV